ncbi:MAG TPA: heavy metal-binding domain-containing protein, partial [Usitatibacter sp.]|nr:heavy metal-binding domain-containing protein [Usitatibacter sp.]
MNARQGVATLLAVAAVAGIGFASYRIGMDRGMKSSGPAAQAANGAAPKAAADAANGRRILYWYDPMYPDERFDKPGKSPHM